MIQVEHLVRRFDELTAVADVSFQVSEAVTFALALALFRRE
jgi:ABC-type branched-subunit amino acid transport system ATPase component